MTEERSLATMSQGGAVTTAGSAAGTLALAMLSDAEFEARLSALKKGQERVARVQRELMEQDVDFGKIPGTGDKPTLYKPGAEKLCNLYGLIPEFKDERAIGDGVAAPTIRVYMTCYLHAGAEGPVVGMGVGECNSWEKKYRWREGQRSCPECGVIGAVIPGKEEYGGGWLCWKRKGGCGVKFAKDDSRITGQQAGQVENPDPYDLCNTIVKMAAKRAYVDAALRTTATSGLFTQDVEDMAPAEPPANGHPTEAPRSTSVPRPTAPQAPKAEPADETSAFFKAAIGLGFANPKKVLDALGVNSLDAWTAKGRTLADALDELEAMTGKKATA